MSTPSMSDLQGMFTAARRLTAAVGPNTDSGVAEEMRLNRVAKTSAYGGSISMAHERPTDPMFYWRNTNLPYDIWRHDELAKVREFCNTPEAPIWMGDYSFKAIGDVAVGDEVIGWSYSIGTRGEQRKKLRRTTVLAVSRRIAPEVVRVTMESGRVIRCTPDHMWSNPLYSPGAKKRRPGDPWFHEYLPAQVGRELVHVIEPTEELTSDKERMTAAWLSGIYDGEGCGNSIGQSETANPNVCQRIKDSLDLLGIEWTQTEWAIHFRQAGRRTGARQDLVNFLNWTEPTRKVTKANERAILGTPNAGRDRVISIESEGPGEVVSMQTETGNYVAWGYASKNCRILYLTHPVIGSVIDVFSTYPLVGMELVCPKSDDLADFYNQLFLDDLGYEDYLIDVGKEYWKVGEAFPLGSFNELLGTWEADELMLPEDVKVVRSPFLKEPRFEMKLPAHIRKIINERKPEYEYRELMTKYPELARYATSADFASTEERDDPRVWIPVSNMVMSQVKHRGDFFHERGVPILLRAFRPLVQEEMLNAAQDAIASRLYTPLILAKIGASASDLGTDAPWVPTSADLDAFATDMNAALAADFRLITHHFAVSIENVFGRENMPDLNPDFERLQERMLQAFGMSKTMLSGASSGETYAADAMNRDLLTQLLSTFQKRIKRFVRRRAEVVAEAQGHYDFEMKGGRAVPVMEEVVETNPESGEQRIVRQPKLLLPDLRIRSMNLKDEENLHALLEGLREAGVPISMRTRLVNVPVDLEEEMEATKREQVAQAVAAQETRRETYLALRKKNLPIPDDLKADFEPKVIHPGGDQTGAGTQGELPLDGEQPLPTIGYTEPAPMVALVPTQEDILAQEKAEGQGGESNVTPMPMNRALMVTEQQPTNRVPESDEMRADMPKASALDDTSLFDPMRRVASRPVEDDDRIQMISRIVASEEEGGEDIEEMVPVIGSYHTRHLANRRAIEAWFMAPEWNPSAPEGETV